MPLIDSLIEAIFYNIGGAETPESYSLSISAQLLSHLTFWISWLGMMVIVVKIFGREIELEWQLLSFLIPIIIAWLLFRLVEYCLFRSKWSWTKQ